MKKNMVLIICFLSSFNSYASDSTEMMNTIANLKSKVVALDSTAHSLSDSNKILAKTLDTLQKAKTAAGIDLVDEMTIDSLKHHPEILYKETLLKKGNWKDPINKLAFFAAFVLLIIFLYMAFYLANRSSLCLDESYYNDNLIKLDKNGPYYIDKEGNRIYKDDKGNSLPKPPYSYARVQMFWWTIIILGTHIIFFGITGVLLPLNTTSVILLGLGAMVLVTGRLIDKQQIQDSSIPLGSRTQDKNYSNNFFINILSDEKGVSLHRFQTIVFNVVFGLGFLAYFFKSISKSSQYPYTEFNEWQFALLGISAAAYLGLKATENKDTQAKDDKEKKVETPAPEKPL